MDRQKTGALIAQMRKERGLTQRELAEQLHISDRTVSKWEQNLSVPDADMLLALSRALDTPVSALLGDAAVAADNELASIAAKLEVINLQLARRQESRRRALRWLFALLGLAALAVLAALVSLGSPYLGWDYGDPETAVLGVGLHAFEWVSVRLAPALLIVSVIGLILTRKRS